MADDPSKRVVFFTFGCGALLGSVLGVSLVVHLLHLSAWIAVVVTVAMAIGHGLLAVKFGERFWEAWRWW